MRHSRLSLPLSLLAIAVLLGAPALLSNCGGGKSPSPSGRKVPRVVLITIDTLRADRLHCYGYERPTSPNLDRLASEGILFENAQVPRGSTWPSLTTILTGKYPITHGVRKNGERLSGEHDMVAAMFQDEGFRTAGFITNMIRCPYNGFDDGPEKFFSPMTHAEADRAVTEGATKWLRENRDEPFFLWVHYMDPHKPYSPEPEFDQFTDPAFDFGIPEEFERPDKSARRVAEETSDLDDYLQYVTGRGIDLTDEQLAHIQGLYDGEILAVDHEIGRILDELDALDLAEDTLVIFTSDHGEELYDRNHYFYHAASVYQGVLHVPLIFRLPGTIPKQKRESTLVEASDIVPTVLALTDVPATQPLDGVSLAPLILGEGPRGREAAFAEFAEKKILGERQPIYTVQKDGWKLIQNPDEVHPSVPPFQFYKSAFQIDRLELYNLRTDPGETRNLVEDEPDVAKELRGLLQAYLEEFGKNAGTSLPMDYEGLIHMVHVGYIDRDEARASVEKEYGKTPEQFDRDLERLERK